MMRKLPILVNRDGKPFTGDEKSLQLSSLAARGLLSSLPGGQLNGMMNDYSTLLSAAMMNAAAGSLPNSLPASCLPSASLFNNPALASSSSSIAAAVANLNNLNSFASTGNQPAIQPPTNQTSSPSSTPIAGQPTGNQPNNTSPPSNLNSFALNGLDVVNYHLQHPSPYIQW